MGNPSRRKVYPRSVKGTFRNLKWLVLVVAYGSYYSVPWLRWERLSGPDQAVLFDIYDRRFYIFDLVIHAQDIFWLAGILLIAVLLLFFVTGVAGRVFCGYFCFQTLWTDVFIAIERFVQGERPARIRLDKALWTGEKILKKALTHFLWLLMAFFTGLTFTLYWGDAPQLFREFFAGTAPFPAYATTLFLTATTYVMAGIAREQVCTYMCPYARFQSVMFDADTLVVEYDRKRGEGTAGRRKLSKTLKTPEDRAQQGVGDCVDCGYCVQVCPTGIDIREGLQIECITCALCIDACDTIMGAVGTPTGLVRYASQNASEGKKTRFLRPKIIGYATILIIVSAGVIWGVATQAQMDMSAAQVRQPLYVQLSDGRIQNRYQIKLNNKTERTVIVQLALDGLPADAELSLGQLKEIRMRPEHSLRVMARVRVDPAELSQERTPFRFIARPVNRPDLPEIEHPSQFVVPPGRVGH